MRRDIFDRYHGRLIRELRKLEATMNDQPIARRNARRRVLTAIRRLRGAIDKTFPPIVDRTGVTRLKTFAGRLARLKKAGWVELEHSADAGLWATAGITLKRLEHTDDGDEKRNLPGEYRQAWLIPRWAKAIGLNKPRLREAMKSRKIREAAITAEALASS